ncbi:M17 family metallopeptidase [Roseomonas sp. CECT 9278]|uniref:leucyl aminopeptidase family protein n=1 Tax=Roseomonas sp. CECT 9278 TaxID=2845823 RepID=UPI001E64BD06|nr:leucyl aminopeptidase family protein [Roseomonas sp. CECT 9278]CAH0194547.1 cytosol aminopeptidase [Roseomonas sp. CECT 9278]
MLEGLTARAMGALPLYAVRTDGLTAFLGDLPAAVASFLRATGFTARPGESALLPGEDGLAGAVVGIGQDDAPWAFGALPRSLPAGTAWRLAPGPQDHARATLGWALGAYRPRRHKSGGPSLAVLEVPAEAGTAVATAEAICAARDLINAPAADLGPAELADAVAALAARHGGTCEVVMGDSLDQGFPAVAAVGQGSPRAPRVAVLRWTGAEGGPLVALCGKGVCFDTGGLDLKSSAGMLRMKKDMGGAAVVLAAAEMIMRADLPVRLLVLVGAVENAVSGTAMRPMDVLRTRKGLKVEIGNTDAEGRLVLCDLLTFAAEQQPAMILDCATLTGAARVALGPDLPALFSNDDALAARLLAAGQAVHDPMWRLPLHDGYDSWLDSPFADLSNVSQKPMAGAVTAALFLRRFVPAEIPWAHLDLYAWNDSTRPGRPEGGEAHCARALHAMVEEFARPHATTTAG